MNDSTKQRAARNRTMEVNVAEKAVLRKRLKILERKVLFEDIEDSTICGDLLKVVDFLPEAFADLIIIDPPYNLPKNFAGNKFRKLSDDAYADYLNGWFAKVVACLKPTGSLYICGDWKSTAALHTVMREHLVVLSRITWQRDKGRGAKSNWKNGMEDIWFGVKDEKGYFFNLEAVKIRKKVRAPYKENGKPKDWIQCEDGKFRLTCPSNFWDDITVPYWSMAENTDHPTQKPEKLVAKLILASSREGDVIFDPFLGSGTTSVVAKKLNRHYCGIEMNEDYCLLAEKRLEIAASDPSIQGYVDGVFRERNAPVYPVGHSPDYVSGPLSD
jgi:site-specific DNA-methyltransferase (adenine-specific)